MSLGGTQKVLWKKSTLYPITFHSHQYSPEMNCEMLERNHLSSVALCPEEKFILIWGQMGPSRQYRPYGTAYRIAFLYLEQGEFSLGIVL